MHLSIGVTGHRDLVEDERPALELRVRALFDDLSASYPDLDLQLLTALAEGADRLVAQVAIQLGIPLVAILPMEQAEYEKDFETAESLAEFRSMLSKAQQTITLSMASGEGSLGRDSQYAQLGLFISNHCQVLLTLWDGKPFNAVGGTAQVVNYHLTGVMDGFEGDLSPASLLADNENDLVHQIVCSRNRPDGEPADGLTALDSFWFSSRRDGERSVDMPEAYQLQMGRMQQFARDWRENRPSSIRAVPACWKKNQISKYPPAYTKPIVCSRQRTVWPFTTSCGSTAVCGRFTYWRS